MAARAKNKKSLNDNPLSLSQFQSNFTGMLPSCLSTKIVDQNSGSVGRAYALLQGGCGFDPQPSHTKDFKYGTGCSFAWRSALRK